jgi:hypothetical protein
MFDPGPHFGLGTIFRPLHLIDNAAMAVAAINKILGLWGCILWTKGSSRGADSPVRQ